MTVRAIVLSGGGVKGAFQVGALQAAFDQHPDLVAGAWLGTSTGNLTAAVCAQGRTRDEQLARIAEVEAVYRGIRGNGDIYHGSRWAPAMAWRFFTKPALFDPAPLRDLIYRHVDPQKLRTGSRFACGTVALESGGYVPFIGDDPNIREAILASASMPVYFPPVPIGDASYVDGGLREQTPLGDAVAWLKGQADEDRELWLFLASPLLMGHARSKWSGLAVAGRSLSIALNEVYVNDLASLRDKNRREGYATIRATVVAPTIDYGDALDFNPKTIARMLEDGRRVHVEVPRV